MPFPRCFCWEEKRHYFPSEFSIARTRRARRVADGASRQMRNNQPNYAAWNVCSFFVRVVSIYIASSQPLLRVCAILDVCESWPLVEYRAIFAFATWSSNRSSCFVSRTVASQLSPSCPLSAISDHFCFSFLSSLGKTKHTTRNWICIVARALIWFPPPVFIFRPIF